jgi:hypothetical protein
MEGYGRIIARVNLERGAVCLVQPGKHEYFVSDPQVSEPGCHLSEELEPCRWRTFVSLLRRFRRVAQR